MTIGKEEDHFLRHHRLELYPGVEKFRGELNARNIPTEIVTAGLFDRITRATPPDFMSRFKTLITGDKVSKCKPFPNSYMKGTQTRGLTPKSCLVVENAPMRITAAKEAGAHCVAVCYTLEHKHLTDADEIVASFADLMSSSAIREVLK